MDCSKGWSQGARRDPPFPCSTICEYGRWAQKAQVETVKVIIAGSRSITDYATVERAVTLSGWADVITHVISGRCDWDKPWLPPSVDQIGELWASFNGKEIIPMPAEWAKYGKYAGRRRNVAMAEIAQGLIAVWDGKSRGTAHMIQVMENCGKGWAPKPVYVHRVTV